MEEAKISWIKGRVLYVNGNHLWLARDRKLLQTLDGGVSWKVKAKLPAENVRDVLAVSRLGRRLGRTGFHHFLPVSSDSAVVIANRYIYKLALRVNRLDLITPLVGSRPLSLAVGNGLVCYGEYRSNSEKGPVHIWGAPIEKLEKWYALWRFEGVRHVHGVFFDPFTDAFWVTTGDEDEEVGIWRTDDDFVTLQKIVGISQQYRAVQLLFSLDYVYFGSDTPDEINNIYRMDRTGHTIERLAAVGGSVFFGCKINDFLFFSTAVEPSQVNTTRYAELWGSLTGDSWQVLGRLKKDSWSLKYFQYGQVLFPAGPGDGKHLYFTPMATNFDQQTFVVTLDMLQLSE